MKIKDLFDIKKQTIILTGVSGQLGLDYAKLFLKLGAKVYGLDIEKNKSLNSLKLIYKKQFDYSIVDITNKDQLKKALKSVIESLGDPTVLINNAAIDSPPSSSSKNNGRFEDYQETTWDKVIDVNLKGVFLSCQVFGSYMAKKSNGSIINISSIYGIVSPDQNLYKYRRDRGEVFYKPIAYSASKSGVINLTKYLAVYWASKNIRVNSLILSGVYNDQDQEFLKSYCSRIPIGRMANINDFHGALVYLASSASSYMTGSNLIIDGGWTAI